MTERESIIAETRNYWDYKWSKELWTGIMFFRGERITRKEFEAI